MLSTFALGPAAVLTPPRPAAVSAIKTLPLAASSQAPSLAAPSEAQTLLDEVLQCRVRGYFPFPGGPRGPLAWLFRDTHQAISVFGTGPERLHMDFMTAGGAAHPVWWDEGVKWQVLLGGSIRGEVRVRGAAGTPGSKLARLREVAESYDTDMNLCVARLRASVHRRASCSRFMPAEQVHEQLPNLLRAHAPRGRADQCRGPRAGGRGVERDGRRRAPRSGAAARQHAPDAVPGRCALRLLGGDPGFVALFSRARVRGPQFISWMPRRREQGQPAAPFVVDLRTLTHRHDQRLLLQGSAAG